jgi:hypothetical protein
MLSLVIAGKENKYVVTIKGISGKNRKETIDVFPCGFISKRTN